MTELFFDGGDVGKYVIFESRIEKIDKKEKIKMPAEGAGRLMASS